MSNLIHDSNSTISELTKKLATQLTDRGLRLTTAESCTGGNLAVALCAEENTAEFYDVGMVVFSDAAKERILGVRHETIERFTAVS
ncbi:nicotinamide-nucleotide amidohydrolase family protein, partial [Enterobacter hormaechei]